MSPRSTRGFTVIELLVVIGIIAILLGILIPAISMTQSRAGATKCVSQVGQIAVAMNAYVKDNRNYYPAGTTAASPWSDAIPDKWHVVGGLDAADAATRPLGKYTSNSLEVAQCPLDNGDDQGGGSSRYATTGSSYRYPENPATSAATYAYMYVYGGIVALEGHRATEFAFPTKKAVIHDTPMATVCAAATAANQWHNTEDPLKGGMGFADGHGEERARKSPTATITTWPSGFTASDGTVSGNNATPAQIDALVAMKEQYY